MTSHHSLNTPSSNFGSDRCNLTLPSTTGLLAFFGQQGSHCNSHSTKTTCFDRHLLILCYNDYDFFFRKIDKFDDDEENEDCVFSFWFQSSRCANGKSKMWFCFEVCVPLLALQDLLLVLEAGPVTVMATNRWLPLLSSLILSSLVANFSPD